MIIYLFAAARSASQRLRGEVDNLITQVSFYQSGARQRTNITVVIIQCANEMWSHWNNTNMSFQQRITESNDAHNKLQSHLSKTMQEIYDQEKHIEALKKAIRDKGPPLKVLLKTSELSSYFFAGTQVSQTRLEARTHRPDVELCRDPPHHRLVEEVEYLFVSEDGWDGMVPILFHSSLQVGQLQESIDLLNRKLNEAEMAHQV